MDGGGQKCALARDTVNTAEKRDTHVHLAQRGVSYLVTMVYGFTDTAN